MRIFDGYVKERFRQLPDGRTLFLPKGEDGPAYLVPDEATRDWLERQLKTSGVVMAVLAAMLGRFLYFRGAFRWPMLLAIPVILWAKWRIAALAAERLEEIHDARRFERPLQHSLYEDSDRNRHRAGWPISRRTFEWSGKSRPRRRFS